MNEIDLEIVKAKQKIKDLQKVKKQMRKLHKLEQVLYKPPVYFVVNDIWGTLCYTFLRIVRKPDD